MPPARRVAGFSVLSNAAPKMVGLMPDQSNFCDASSSRSRRISSVNCGTTISSLPNSPPFTYGNASRFSGKYESRCPSGVSSTLNRSITAWRIWLARYPFR